MPATKRRAHFTHSRRAELVAPASCRRFCAPTTELLPTFSNATRSAPFLTVDATLALQSTYQFHRCGPATPTTRNPPRIRSLRTMHAQPIYFHILAQKWVRGGRRLQ